MARIIDIRRIESFESYLRSDEKSENTIAKYMRDIRAFAMFAAERVVDKSLVMEYKNHLSKKYTVVSANSMLAAINAFFRFSGWEDCCIKQFKIQKQVYCSEEKELSKAEYFRLVEVAKSKGNERLHLILQTICGTGIRVSELKFITVEAVRKGEAIVSCKNKTRTVFIVRRLQKSLLKYVKSRKITSGCVFITKSGRPMSRCNIWREMKSLCKQAGVSSSKVFPHNLRKLFARTFHRIDKDLAKLADILGHTSINTTRIYIITTGNEHRRKMENMRLII